MGYRFLENLKEALGTHQATHKDSSRPDYQDQKEKKTRTPSEMP
jgi:hypothetical protein